MMTFSFSLRARAASVLLCVLLAACSGSGGSSDTPSTPAGNISGVAFDSELAGAHVYVSRYDGLFYGEGVTDAEGRFSIDVSGDSQVLRVETKGGAFVDEYTGKTYQELFNQTDGALRLYLNYTAGSSLVIAPTIYTTLAAALADVLIGQGADPAVAVDQANDTISSILGIDIVTTIPHNVTRAPAGGVSDVSIEYGFYCAAISALVAQSGQRPFEFTKIASDDIELDGFMDEVTPVGSAVLDLGDKGYRHALALGALRMAVSKRNRTGWGIDQVLPFAQRLNASTHPLFGAKANEIEPLEALKPVISTLSWWYDEVYFETAVGTVDLSFAVDDAIGLQSIDVEIGGQTFLAPDVTAPVVTVNTAQLADGIHTVTITAHNLLGITSTHVSSIRIANHGLAIVDVQPGNGEMVAGNTAFSAHITDPTGIAAVDFLIDGNRFSSPDEGDTRSANYFTPQLTDGTHVFTIRAENGVGIVSEQSVPFITDNTAPTIEFWLAPGAYLEKVVTLVVMHDDDSVVALNINDNELANTGVIKQDGKAFSSFLLDTQVYPDSSREIVAIAVDKAANSTTEKLTAVIDNTPPSLNFSLPRDGEAVSGEFHLNFNADDASGFADKPFEILIDGAHTAWVSNEWRSDTINPNRYGKGWHKISLAAEDASGKKTTISQNIYFDI